ncbi:hypothetical protein U1P98_03700 [Lysinibacillus irui]|uniref:Uncharacterized protein n=1 Tax=Lysinibacillus irui TaxID=2998077 RepID=A0AAJ5RLC0_9BACI|nr:MULTISPECIES: hypothetical protein [Lysinibacillus]MEA0552813.1 hypothetical protein [Lysinibacillus irui]MEA0565912.1 hypothetical protein [Lysinibacillus irui]MEA0975393.1 hypothetical protein [Lysinibacillus irui]MEA1041547.1 hypothetical protein [Lysinibacillus irui]WDV05135.1 hypothetical protein OU989_12510 [Lysinibacillus irui]
MKKRYKLLLGILLPLLILYISTMLLTRDTDFTTEVTERLDLEEIHEIEIIRSSDEKTITLTDTAKINQMMEPFKDLPLKKIWFAKSDFKEAYWITLSTNNDREIGLRLDDDKHLFVYLYEENYMKDYKLTQDFDMTFIEQHFQK